jgi:teichuronic acid biosynthesis glycosyltransferase TuaC
VDLEKFQPLGSAKEQLGLSGPTVLSVGNLIPLKGHDLVIRALAKLADAHLLIVGKGTMKESLLALAQQLGLNDRVRFVPEVTQAELVTYYSAADVTVLASSNEGMPNVVLESLACGTPVIATRVGGIPEVLKEPDGGVLLPTRSAKAITVALETLLANPPGRERVRATVIDKSWERTTGELKKLFRAVCAPNMI